MVEQRIREDTINYKNKIENECIYYLSTYATPEKQATFYESRNQFEPLLKYY